MIIYMSDGSNEAREETKATTESGLIRAAKRLWPYQRDYAGTLRIKFQWPGEENYPVRTMII